MINEEQVRTLRNNANNRMKMLEGQAATVRAEMADLQERFNNKQNQLGGIAQQVIETNGTLASLNAVLGDTATTGVATSLPPQRRLQQQADLDDGA